MKISTLTLITRWVVCLGAAALAVFAWIYNPCHLITAGLILAFGLNVKWAEKE